MNNPNLEIACRIIAKKLFFMTIYTEGLDEIIHAAHVQYRKGKCRYDVPVAVAKGIKAGRGKTEHEIDMISYYLCKILKLA